MPLESLAPDALVVRVKGRVGPIGVGHRLAPERHRYEDVGHQAYLNASFLLRLPNRLQVEPIERGAHVIHLGDRHAGVLDGVAKHLGDLAHAVEASIVLGVARPIDVGATIVGMDAHDQARERHLSNTDGGDLARLQVATHRHDLLPGERILASHRAARIFWPAAPIDCSIAHDDRKIDRLHSGCLRREQGE